MHTRRLAAYKQPGFGEHDQAAPRRNSPFLYWLHDPHGRPFRGHARAAAGRGRAAWRQHRRSDRRAGRDTPSRRPRARSGRPSSIAVRINSSRGNWIIVAPGAGCAERGVACPRELRSDRDKPHEQRHRARTSAPAQAVRCGSGPSARTRAAASSTSSISRAGTISLPGFTIFGNKSPRTVQPTMRPAVASSRG